MSLRARKSKTISFTARSEYRSATTTIKIAILDDYVNIALRSADWSCFRARPETKKSRLVKSKSLTMAALEPGSPAGAGAGRDRQSDRDLTLGRVSDYESGVCKVKKEIPD